MVIFFGIVPVIFTAYVQTLSWSMLPVALPLSVAIGLMGANVMIVNNYRDIDDDREAGKHTLAVIIGPKATLALYITNCFLALLLVEIATITRIDVLWQLAPLAYINISWILWQRMRVSKGHELNPILGKTAVTMFLLSVCLLVAFATA